MSRHGVVVRAPSPLTASVDAKRRARSPSQGQSLRLWGCWGLQDLIESSSFISHVFQFTKLHLVFSIFFKFIHAWSLKGENLDGLYLGYAWIPWAPEPKARLLAFSFDRSNRSLKGSSKAGLIRKIHEDYPHVIGPPVGCKASASDVQPWLKVSGFEAKLQWVKICENSWRIRQIL